MVCKEDYFFTTPIADSEMPLLQVASHRLYYAIP